MTGQVSLDEVARRLRAELIEIAVDQISKPIAHEFDIRIALRDDGAEAGGGTGVQVTASSRSVQPVTTEVQVDVRPSGDGLVIERAGATPSLEVMVDEAHPEISASLHHRMSDFVAGCIASAVARLNAEMQRRLGQTGRWA